MMASNMTASPVALSRRRFLTLVTATAASTALAACSSGSATPAAPAAPATPTTGAPTMPPTAAAPTTAPTMTPPTVVPSTPAPTAPAASVVTGAATTTSGAAMPNTLAPDASPRFRAVATRVMAAMAAAVIPHPRPLSVAPGSRLTLGPFGDGEGRGNWYLPCAVDGEMRYHRGAVGHVNCPTAPRTS